MAKKKVPTSGAMGMAARGRINVQVWLTAEEHTIIEAAAKADGRSKTQVILRGGLEYAKKILKKNQTAIDSL